ncbi:MAG: alpha-galactosidase [Bacilli bacterium]|nr:alpha-galactosidase [Bacilli bacterium]
MIKITGSILHLETKKTAYIMEITPSGLLLHHYYHEAVPFYDYRPILQHLEGGMGTACLYEGNPNEFIDALDMELSTIGKGDYREHLLSLYHDEEGFMNNFKVTGYELLDHAPNDGGLPMSYGADQVLDIRLWDEEFQVSCHLIYQVYEESDVITRFLQIKNSSQKSYRLQRAMSLELDMTSNDYSLMTFDGTWSKERHIHEKPLTSGIYIHDSKCGASSNKHNPFVILKEANTNEDQGIAYGLNLVYSGNHATIIEVTPNHKMRVLMGINPHAFETLLAPEAVFTTPEAVMTFSSEGLNELSQHMHHFINHHIVRGPYQNKPRPILLNNWEATYFNFNEKIILEMAKKAKDVGVEVFVLDDGWFGKRTTDNSSLGDWFTNLKKLPHGLSGLSEKIKAMGLGFGLWVEPEMVNMDSDYYRLHPTHALLPKSGKPSLGRNQLHLDLTNPEVQTYLIETLSGIFNEAKVDYVKWDYNRNMTELYSHSAHYQGDYTHRYMLGLYHILDTLVKRFPHVLFESCASGGNRFDLGMLCYMSQIWTSDDTDYYERLFIQSGTSYGYPLSVMGSHVSTTPNHQTLRVTPLSSRFHVACFGLLGYELDLDDLSSEEVQTVKKQIAFYKKYRLHFQYGTFYRGYYSIFNRNNTFWYVKKDEEVIIGFFQGLIHPSMSEDVLRIKGLQPNQTYYLSNIEEKVNLAVFGSLIRMVLPFRIKINGTLHRIICRVYRFKSDQERFIVYGKALSSYGVRLNQQFMGSGFNDRVRVLGDFGSRLYSLVPTNTKTNYHLKRRKD